MTQASGVSIAGLQTLVQGASAGQGYFLFLVSKTPITPPETVGYFWLYGQGNGGPSELYIFKRGILSAPGQAVQLWPVLPESALKYQVDVLWKHAGLNWFINTF